MARLVTLLLVGCCAAQVADTSAAEPLELKLVEVSKIWDQGPHNAFTDLIRFDDQFFCTFREAEHHVYGRDGRIRVIASDDGKTWRSAALLAEKGVDLRDPKFSITPDGRLMIVCGGSVYEGKKFIGRQPRVAFSADGSEWTKPQKILGEGDWLWRVTWHNDVAYGVSRKPTPAADDGDETVASLYGSRDGLKWELITNWDLINRPNEATLRIMPDGEMIALVRHEKGDKVGWIGTSRPPYAKWDWAKTKHRLGGPNFIRLPEEKFDDQLIAATRSYAGGAKTVVGAMTRKDFEPVLTLPSGGDTSYAGLLWHNGLLWVSYYASHEGKASIYLAKIKVE